jgi:hypothetical protein
MGLALDEPKANDEKIEAEGLFFVADSDVADLIRSSGGLSIDYAKGWFRKGFQLNLLGQGSC